MLIFLCAYSYDPSNIVALHCSLFNSIGTESKPTGVRRNINMLFTKFSCLKVFFVLDRGDSEQARAERGLWGLKPLPFFKFIQKCPSQTNSNDTVVNKTKCI